MPQAADEFRVGKHGLHREWVLVISSVYICISTAASRQSGKVRPDLYDDGRFPPGRQPEWQVKTTEIPLECGLPLVRAVVSSEGGSDAGAPGRLRLRLRVQRGWGTDRMPLSGDVS
jgi:hypothetical protein